MSMSTPESSIKVDIGSVLVELVESLVGAPIKILRNSIKNEEWFKGIILSTVLLEVIGQLKLRARFEGKIKPQRFERLGLEQIIMFLFASELIDQSTYTKMMEVRRMRNKLVHRLGEGLTLDPKEAKATINKAIECLKALGLYE